MENLEIPASIWLNLAVLVAAGGFVWIKLARSGAAAKRRQNRARPGVNAGRPAR
jgi:hypothetical protein